MCDSPPPPPPPAAAAPPVTTIIDNNNNNNISEEIDNWPPPPPNRTSDPPPPPPPMDDNDDDNNIPEEIDNESDHEDDIKAMDQLRRSLHERRVSALQSSISEDFFSSSDEDDFKRMSIGTSYISNNDNNITRPSRKSILQDDREWHVVKQNRFGRKQSRIIVVDVHHRALRFLNNDRKMRSEYPFTEILEVNRCLSKIGEYSMEVLVIFRGKRSYRLTFISDLDAYAFCEMINAILTQNAFFRPRNDRSSIESMHLKQPHHSTRFSQDSTMSTNDNTQLRIDTSQHSLTYDNHSPQPPSPSFLDASGQPIPDEMIAADYLDYHVKKKNKYGMKQDRILVLNSRKRTLLLLDDKRKFKKEFDVKNIWQVEIPKSKTGKSRAYVIFATSQKQTPFNLYFVDVFDRIHFCERLTTLGQHITIKDQSDDVVNDHCLRFTVLKVNKMAVKKKRILYLDCVKQVIRSLNTKAAVKDTPIGDGILRKVQKSVLDKRAATLTFTNRSDWNFIFSDAAACERFVVRCRSVAMGDYKPSNQINHFIEDDYYTNSRNIGKNSAASLLESDKWRHRVTIFCGTWNVGNAGFPTEKMNQFIPPRLYDIYVIGLQECNKKDQWEKELRAYVGGEWNQDEESTYVTILSRNLWEICLFVFIRKEHAFKVSNLESHTVACGIGDVMGNKGAVAVSFDFQDTPIIFIVSHLAARAERLEQRKENFQKIMRQLRFGHPDWDILSQYPHIIWLGDLNYRVDMGWDETLEAVGQGNYNKLLENDQLLREMTKKNVFAGFQEGDITFAPTYRMERDEEAYNNKRNQPPSYTDRVLWHSWENRDDLKLIKYNSAAAVWGSDHRPVYATFEFMPILPYPLGIDPSRTKFPPCEIKLNKLQFISVLDSKDYSRLLLRIRARWLENDVDTIDVSVSNDEKTFQWQAWVVLHPFTFNPGFLMSQHLQVAICNSTDDGEAIQEIAFGTLSMKDAIKETQGFTLALKKEGCISGYLSGEYIMNVLK